MYILFLIIGYWLMFHSLFSEFQDEFKQRKWTDGTMFDSNNFQTLSVVSIQPTVSFKCSVRRKCSETEVDNTSAAMLDDRGKCSALLTREGFFDFVTFRTQCDRSFPVSLVCQHKTKTIVFNNDLSDIKVSTVDGFYSLRVFSSCDAGWFVVDNMCINIYQCKQCKTSNITAHEQCVTHGGYLADRIFKNTSITKISKGYMLNHNSSLLMSFWDMFFHESYFSELNLSRKMYDQKANFAMDQNILCATHTLELCQENGMVLAVTNKYYTYKFFVYSGPWSITF